MTRAYNVAAWQRDFARAFAAGITLECSPTRARGCLLLADNDEPELTADMDLICPTCNGSGEGRTSESRCTSCGGSGVERVITDDSGPDYDELRRQHADLYLSATKVQRADRRALVEQIQHPLGAK